MRVHMTSAVLTLPHNRLPQLEMAKEWADDIAQNITGAKDADTSRAIDLADKALDFAEADYPSQEQKLALSKVQQLTGAPLVGEAAMRQ